MAFRRNVGSRVLTRTKRSTTWALCSVPTGYSSLLQNVKAVAVAIPSTTLLDLVPFTITRTVGIVSIATDQEAASEDQIGAFGFGVVNRVAGALGITALPGPATDCGWPGWFVHRFFSQKYEFHTAAASMLPSKEYVFDSKAMRKVEAEQDLVFMVENFDANNGLRFAVSFRMLIKTG